MRKDVRVNDNRWFAAWVVVGCALAFGVVSFASDQPLAVDKFQTFLDRDLPEGVFRGKGILWVAESDARYIFHLVGKRFSLDESRWIGPKENRLVLIGRNLDGEQLRRRLDLQSEIGWRV